MRLLTIFWLFLIAGLSLMPLHYKVELGTTGKLHQIGHFGAFFVAAALFCSGTRTASQKLIRCSGAAALAFLLELSEMLVYKNVFEWTDVAVDALGIASGCAALVWLQTFASPAKIRRPPSERK